MNPIFLSQDLPLSKLKFYIPTVLNICTCDPFYSTLTCNDQEICSHFHGHCQLILKATHSTGFYLHFTWKKTPTNQPKRLSVLMNFTQLWCDMVCPHLQSEPLISWSLTLSRTEQPLSSQQNSTAFSPNPNRTSYLP